RGGEESCYQKKTGIYQYFLRRPHKNIQHLFYLATTTPAVIQREREPIKVEAKPNNSPRAYNFGWGRGAASSALFPRLLFCGVLAFTGIIVAIIRSRFY